MKRVRTILKNLALIIIGITLVSACSNNNNSSSCGNLPTLYYTVSTPNPENQIYHIDLKCNGWLNDTIDFKIAKWMPGYYQIMNYSNNVSNVSATNENGDPLTIKPLNQNTWRLVLKNNTPFKLSYQVTATRKFVATSFLDSTHGYIVPPSLFMYIDNYLNTPVSVNIELISKWKNIVTGLETKNDKPNEFMAPNIDILFDCPFLIGNLQELPSFWIDSIEHRFIGYNMGEFDKEQFIGNLKKAIQASINIIGDIPYQKYTFIAIGPGFGGIEHLNNTTVSFDGSRLNQKESMTKLMSFLTHEYFHHYNVKRIRPFELGPFCYDNENRTNLLWVSEGFTVYYEYIILRRANLISDQEFLESIEKKIMINENNPGRLFQSLSQSSYNTWSDGPFGKQGKDAGKTISYYDKGPLLGLILDLTIRNATDNKKSLDDVMKQLYWQFYKKLNRGFTDAELQQTCEAIAGISLSNEFEYVYSTNEIDYNKYLSYAGLKVTELKSTNNKRSFALAKLNNVNSLQIAILSGLQGK